MAEARQLTSDKSVANAPPGRHRVADNLYLDVDPPSGAKAGKRRWLFRYKYLGRQRDMGLGGYPAISLKVARETALQGRQLLAQGKDPIQERRGEQARALPTFGVFSTEWIDQNSPAWRNPKHVDQWRMTMRVYAAKLTELPLDQVSTEAVLAALKPIWTAKPETARRTQGRIERIMDGARAAHPTLGENPARWRGRLEHLLPARKKLTRGHHKALPFDKLPAFMAALQSHFGSGPDALEFLVLTAARSGEVREARWSEIDLDAQLWTVPAERMKANREQRVPLSPEAVAVLERRSHDGEFIFGGGRTRRQAAGDDHPLSTGALERVLDRMAVGFTVHGFRSTFRDWAGDKTEHPREVIEAALAHVVGSETERAYRRSDALEKRQMLMRDWATFCMSCRVETTGEQPSG